MFSSSRPRTAGRLHSVRVLDLFGAVLDGIGGEDVSCNLGRQCGAVTSIVAQVVVSELEDGCGEHTVRHGSETRIGYGHGLNEQGISCEGGRVQVGRAFEVCGGIFIRTEHDSRESHATEVDGWLKDSLESCSLLGILNHDEQRVTAFCLGEIANMYLRILSKECNDLSLERVLPLNYIPILQ